MVAIHVIAPLIWRSHRRRTYRTLGRSSGGPGGPKRRIFRQSFETEAGVIDNALDGVEVASKVEEVVDKVDEKSKRWKNL